jgi:DnaJ-class molecular chaperone
LRIGQRMSYPWSSDFVQTKSANKNLFRSCSINTEVSWKQMLTGKRIILQGQAKGLCQMCKGSARSRDVSATCIPRLETSNPILYRILRAGVTSKCGQ